MKKMRRFAGLLLAMVMVFALAVPAMADTADLTGHTYKAYQIFSGTQAEGSSVLGNIEWGTGINSTNFLNALKASNDFGTPNAFADCTTAQDVAEVVANWTDSSAQAKAFAKLAYTNKTGEGITCVSGQTDLDAGYYLVVDVTDFNSEDETGDSVYNLALLQLTNKGTFEIQNKTSVPTVEKKVDDINDSNNTEDEVQWNDSADYDIGDDVPFKLEATLADNVEDYYWYKIVFHDTLSAGLTYNYDAKVYFGETDVTSYFTITHENGSLTITCNDVKAFGATNGSVITVKYTAELNKNAVIGSVGNPNVVYLEYSNNPNWAPDADNDGTPDVPGSPDEPETPPENPPTSNTPEDKVIVFTYNVIVNKVDEAGKALAGAGFTLYKWDDDVEGEDKWVAVGSEIKDVTTFEWKGLDDGDYKLVETTTPAGYNTIDPIEFTITATHDLESDDPRLTALSGGDLFTGDVETGALTADVENKAGATLPETGGMGTTLFYVIGATLVLGAAVVMVTRKRMSAN